MLGEVSQTKREKRLMNFTLMASNYQVRISIFKIHNKLKQSSLNAEAIYLLTPLNISAIIRPFLALLNRNARISL